MTKSEKRERAAEAASLCRRGIAILGKTLRLNWLSEEEGALGYTSCGNPATVNVAWYLEFFFKPLDEGRRKVFRAGVFAHELLHQVFTNFDYTNAITRSMKNQGEAAIFMEFANTLEDPAIEYFAPNVFGGWLLDCLHFMIRHIYKMSPGIGDEPTPYRQLINALIAFGDMGIVKGEFTFPEAKEYFEKVAPIYNKGIECPDSKMRIDYAMECFEICRPLWEKDLEFEEIMNKLLEELKKSLSMTGEGSDGEGMSMPSSSSSKRRSKMLKKMDSSKKGSKGSSDGEMSEDGNGGSSSEEDEGEDGDSDEKDGEGGSAKSGSESSDNPSSGSSSEGDDSDSEDGEDGDGDITASEDEANSVADNEAEEFVSDETLAEIESSIEKAEKEALKAEEKARKESGEAPLPDFDIKGKWHGSSECKNVRCSSGSSAEALYSSFVSRYSWDIKRLGKTLDKIFAADKEEQHRATSGDYNIMRGSIGCSAKIFDKRREPGNKKDVAVVLCVDLSGSMGCEGRIENARRASIVFAEALEKLHIPYYIMGFSADEGHDEGAYHIHFVDWSGRKKDKVTLATMHARDNNFDGYSIRYAANLLKERHESNKILFVISDGEPACYSYRGREGIADTTMAIKESRKIADTVFGIALGTSCPVSTLHAMYGKDFIAVNDPNLLTSVLCKKLEKVIKAH